MKNFIVSVLVFSFSVINAQEKALQGNYVSVGKERGFELKINPDNTYEMVFLHGNLTQVKDTIFFENKMASVSSFIVKQFPVTKKTNSLEIKVKASTSSPFYVYNKLYYGYQNNETDEINFIRFNEKDNSSYYSDSIQDVNFTINKPKYFYLVERLSETNFVSKYTINENIGKIEIEYLPNNFNRIELVGVIDEQNIINIFQRKEKFESRDFLSFQNKATLLENSDIVSPFELVNNPNLKLPDIEEYSELQHPYETLEEQANNQRFEFKYVIDNTFKEALNRLNKIPEKFLVVYADPKNKNEIEEFNSFVKSQEAYLSSIMYGEYLPEYDFYNYYLASSKDKNLFDSKISEPQIVILNNEGTKIYSTTGTLSQNKTLFDYYSQLSYKLKVVSNRAKIDKKLLDKKTSIPELKKAFSYILNLETQYATDFAEDVPAVQYDNIQVEPVDSAAVVVETSLEDYTDYYKVKDEQNLYKSKLTKEVVLPKWKQVLDYYSKQSNVDIELVKILRREIANNGFSFKLFNDNKTQISDLDYQALDYLLNNYKEIVTIENNFSGTDENYEYNYYYANLKTDLNSFFLEKTSAFSTENQTQIEKTLKYYKKYLEVLDSNTEAQSLYIYALYNNYDKIEDKEEIYVMFEKYFNSITKQADNLFESLDKAFVEEYKNDYNSTWQSFKSSFANLLNKVAWLVVEKEKSSELIKKAIHWSETSLKVENNNGYYLDTLAQLYYKNRQKDLAIKTQKQALEAMQEDKDSESYLEMEQVLEKMLNGKY